MAYGVKASSQHSTNMISPIAFTSTVHGLLTLRHHSLRTAVSSNYVKANQKLLCSKACAQNDNKSRRQSGIRPKQSLGQNFLRDRNVVSNIVHAFEKAKQTNCPDSQVVEVGPGLGALTDELLASFGSLYAIEIDQRAVAHLKESFPNLHVEHGDVLDTDWEFLSQKLGAPLAVIGNLPYNIMSQILLSLLEAPVGAVKIAVVMMQLEVARRIISPPRCKSYGILSVLSQLYAKPTILFTVPPKSFYPVPEVTSAVVHFEFKPCETFDATNITLTRGLRLVLKSAFGQRRKVLRNSLKSLCDTQNVSLPSHWDDKRAEELSPLEFVSLTRHLFEADLRKKHNLADVKRTVWR